MTESMKATPTPAESYVIGSQNVLPNGCAHLPMRVACIKHNGATLTVPVGELAQHAEALDDGDSGTEYLLTFKTITLGEYQAMGDFDGF